MNQTSLTFCEKYLIKKVRLPRRMTHYCVDEYLNISLIYLPKAEANAVELFKYIFHKIL